jgi:hypothetical protein
MSIKYTHIILWVASLFRLLYKKIYLNYFFSKSNKLLYLGGAAQMDSAFLWGVGPHLKNHRIIPYMCLVTVVHPAARLGITHRNELPDA